MMRFVWLPMLAAACLTLGCDEVTTHLIRAPTTQDAAPVPIDASPGQGGSTDAALGKPLRCGPKPCACDDGEDNDGDRLVDGLDPECTGNADDDESSFATGQRSEDEESCLDCFWDQNKGRGDDACLYPAECLYGVPPPMPLPGGCASCEPSERCVDKCAKSTPNGCDCFGCCEIFRPDQSSVAVVLTAQCSLENIDDELSCPRCIPSAGCGNPCGPCELCPGRSLSDLSPSCTKGPNPTPACDEGHQVCTAETPCPPDYYCQLGCCLYIVQ